MKMPAKNSHAMRVLEALKGKGPVTVGQGIELHGVIGQGMDDTLAVYQELMARGCLDHRHGRFFISAELAQRYDPSVVVPDAAPKVPPRVAPPFRPLSDKYKVSSRGMRPGSNDMLGLPSAYAKLEGDE